MEIIEEEKVYEDGETGTVFTDMKRELMDEEKYHSYAEKQAKTECPVIDILIEGIKARALIDTGSTITCISSEFYEKHYKILHKCPTLPMVGLQVTGFTGEKSTRIKIQTRAATQLNEIKTDLNYIIVPKLTRECILGIDTHKYLKMIIDVDNQSILISGRNGEKTQIHYGTEALLSADAELTQINYSQAEEYGYPVNLDEGRELPSWDNQKPLDITDQEIHDKITSIDPLHQEQKQELEKLIKRHRSVFSKRLGRCRTYSHTLRVTSCEPFFKRSYPVPIQYREKVDAEIQRMLKLDVIERSYSSHINPLVPVIKKNGSVRVCLDARELNERLLPDHDGPEEMDTVLRKCDNARVMSSIDLASSFWQIPLAPESREFTAFLHQGKTYHHKVVPFGLKVSGAALARGTENVLKGLEEYVIDFVDDLLCISSTFDEHINLLDLLFQRIGEAGFTINFEKVEFCRQELKFLGHILNTQGIKPDPDKIKAIREFPQPKNPKQLKGFLGLVNYCGKFTHELANEVAPLLDLIRKGVKWKWCDVHENAFMRCKTIFSTAMINYHPVRTKPFYLVTDASIQALGAFLYQEDENGQKNLIVLASRTLKGPELNYCTTELELLAIVWALSKFRPYILGSTVTVRTDHHALTFLSTCRFLSARLTRWMLAIQDYDLKVEHISGAKNCIADTLSRLTEIPPNDDATIALLTTRKPSKELAALIKNIDVYQQKDPKLSEIITKLQKRIDHKDYELKDMILVKGREHKKIVLPTWITNKLIKEIHEIYGHIGIKKCVKMIEENFCAKRLRAQISKYIATCDSCQRNKLYTQGVYAETLPIIPSTIGELVSIDFYGPLPTSRGGVKHILAVIDVFSKYVCLYAIRKADTRTTIAKLRSYFETYGRPKRVQTDHGTQFTAKGWKSFLQTEGVKHVWSAIRHPQSNVIERTNKELGRFFRTLTSDKHKNWATWLPFIQECLNETYHDTTEFTPIEIQMDKKPTRIWANWISLPENKEPEYTEKLRLVYNNIKTKGEKRAEKQNRDKRFTTFNEGDLVLVKACNVSDLDNGITAKFLSIYEGPYRVDNVLSKCTYVLSDPNTKRLRGKFHVSSLRPYNDAKPQDSTNEAPITEGIRDRENPVNTSSEESGGSTVKNR